MLFILFSTLTTFACIQNVQQEIIASQNRAASLKLSANGKFHGRSYTQAVVNGFGLDNHFQGVHIFADQKHFIISGGDIYRKIGHLFLGEFAHGKSKSKILKKFKVGTQKFWHAGGLGGANDVVAVPVEDYKKTRTGRIEFWDFRDNFLHPVHLGIDVPRNHAAAGAATLVQKTDGTYLLGVYDAGVIDFYPSVSTDIRDGFLPNYFSLRGENIATPAGQKNNFGGSSIQILNQCDGKTFLLDFNNNGDTPPITNGDNVLALYEIQFSMGAEKSVSATKIQDFVFDCGKNGCNFSAAANAFENADGGITVFSTNFFRNWLGTFIRSTVY